MKFLHFAIAITFLFYLSNLNAQTWVASEQSHFGIDGFGTVNSDLLTAQQLETAYVWEASDFQSANICWNRTLSPSGGQFKWESIENTQGTYNWSKSDAFVKTVQQYNINLLVLVHPFTHWDQPSKRDIDYDKPNDMTVFKKFIAKMVERYDNDGIDDMPGLLYPIKYYEIGNEPEGPTFGDSPGTYNDFMTTLKAARDTAKAVYPDVKILIGGAAPIYDFQGAVSNNLDTFWKGALNRAIVADYFDIFNFHYFVGQYTADISDYVDYWKQLLNNYGLSEKEIWLTETGSYSGTATFYDGSVWPSQTTEYQASWWIKHSSYSLANGVSKLFDMYYYSDQTGWANAVSFVEIDKTTKKAIYYAQKLIAEKIDAYSSVAQNAYASSGQNQTSGNFKFTVENKPIYILWNDQGGNATLSGLNSDKVRIIKTVPNLNGNGDVVLDGSGNPAFDTTETDVSGGQVTITLTSVPVYVEEISSAPTAPNTPTLKYPANNQNNLPVQLNLIWNKQENSDNYDCQIAADSNFSQILFDNTAVIDTFKQVTTLEHGKKYYWKVRANNSGGPSEWSDTYNFITLLPSPTQLTAQTDMPNGVILTWLDNSNGEAGFIVERKLDNNNFSVIDTVQSNDTSYVDSSVSEGHHYYYKIKSFTHNCESEYSNEVSVILTNVEETELPTEYSLSQNYPNPFNPETRISYQVPSECKITLKIFDILGREIITLVNEEKPAGKYSVDFNASNLASGIYYYRIQAGGYTDIKKCLLLK